MICFCYHKVSSSVIVKRDHQAKRGTENTFWICSGSEFRTNPEQKYRAGSRTVLDPGQKYRAGSITVLDPEHFLRAGFRTVLNSIFL